MHKFRCTFCSLGIYPEATSCINQLRGLQQQQNQAEAERHHQRNIYHKNISDQKLRKPRVFHLVNFDRPVLFSDAISYLKYFKSSTCTLE